MRKELERLFKLDTDVFIVYKVKGMWRIDKIEIKVSCVIDDFVLEGAYCENGYSKIIQFEEIEKREIICITDDYTLAIEKAIEKWIEDKQSPLYVFACSGKRIVIARYNSISSLDKDYKSFTTEKRDVIGFNWKWGRHFITPDFNQVNKYLNKKLINWEEEEKDNEDESQ